MRPEYAEEKEKEDWKLMEEFNEKLKLKNLTRTDEKHTTDAFGYTANDEYVNIELKYRSQKLNENFHIEGISREGKQYTASTIYIESHKIADMLLDFITEKKIPLYVNFLSDGSVIVFNLSKLKHRPRQVAKRIWSELYQGFELGKRQELRIEDAYIYRKENNQYRIIHKP